MERQHKKVIAINTFWQLIGRVVTTGASFVVTIVLARSYGVSTFGTFVTITTLVSFCTILTDFGLNATYLKADERNQYFISFLWFRLFVSSGIIFALIIGAGFAALQGTPIFGITPPLFLGLALFSLTLVPQSLLTSYAAIFQALSQYRKQWVALCAGSLVLLFFVVPVALLHVPLTVIFFGYLLGSSLSAVVAMSLSGKSPFPYQYNWPFLKGLLHKGLPLGFLLIFNLLYFRIDTLLLSALKGTGAVGIYGYAYKYFDFTLTIPLFLSNSLYPFLLKNQKNLRTGGVNEREFFAIFLGIGLLGAVTGFFVAPLIAVISPGYQESVLVLRILLCSLPFFFLTSYLQWLLIARNKERSLMPMYLSAAGLNILLNLLFIPQYSVVAASAITGVCEVLVFILLLLRLYFTKNLRNPR